MPKKMKNRYILIISLVIIMMYVLEALLNGTKSLSIEKYSAGILFISLALLAAFYIKNWHGNILLILYFLFHGIIPFLLGIVSGISKNKTLRNSLLAVTSVLPVIMYLLAHLSYSQGKISENLELQKRIESVTGCCEVTKIT